MPSQVSWLQFDAEQQRRTQLLMSALKDQGTVDELGLGGVRDLIAGRLHPGMSVLFTRAKYVLFVPEIYSTLTRTSASDLIEEGRRREGRLIQELKAYAEESGESPDGIIGQRTGSETRRMASAAYWALLRRWGILKHRGSVNDYCRDLAEAKRLAAQRHVLHSEDDAEAVVASAWAEFPDVDHSRGMNLTFDEAEWLRGVILATERNVPEDDWSLLRWHLDPARQTWVDGVPQAWKHPAADQYPADAAHVMHLGRDLDTLVHGARLLYNYLCLRERPDRGDERAERLADYTERVAEWQEEIDTHWPSADRLDDLDRWGVATLSSRRRTGDSLARWARAMAFARRWHATVESSSDILADPEAERLIRKREGLVKGGRARLGSAERLRDFVGGVGETRFDYNWSVTRRICHDIHAGLGTPIVPFEEA